MLLQIFPNPARKTPHTTRSTSCPIRGTLWEVVSTRSAGPMILQIRWPHGAENWQLVIDPQTARSVLQRMGLPHEVAPLTRARSPALDLEPLPPDWN